MAEFKPCPKCGGEIKRTRMSGKRLYHWGSCADCGKLVPLKKNSNGFKQPSQPTRAEIKEQFAVMYREKTGQEPDSEVWSWYDQTEDVLNAIVENIHDQVKEKKTSHVVFYKIDANEMQYAEFTNLPDAANYYESLATSWSQVWLTKVLKGMKGNG